MQASLKLIFKIRIAKKILRLQQEFLGLNQQFTGKHGL
ncbi:putative uncharacterized protein [Parachlamydia acanthamoebae UV-7]|uniref:Uncharacterized protein n=1 Tax=Parachlamydia acanthamoebae (strain UV7) TaxID=765952 RepID=F8KVS0_PARAV|nr:putative uncharacterized protein [Parachlamydia acanthamoebae UV-7]